MGSAPQSVGIPAPKLPAARRRRHGYRRDLVAIDVHTHAEVSAKGAASLSAELDTASASYFKVEGNRKPTLPEIAAYYRERRMAAVVFTVDAESATGTARRRQRGGRRGRRRTP